MQPKSALAKGRALFWEGEALSQADPSVAKRQRSLPKRNVVPWQKLANGQFSPSFHRSNGLKRIGIMLAFSPRRRSDGKLSRT